METFKLEVYAYPINNNDWEKRHSFYFDAEKFEQSIIDYAHIEGNTYTFPTVQCIEFKGVWG